jgi:DNA polymerase-1
MSEKKRLLLLDGHAMAYRAYHAIPPLTTPDGEPSNAVFGFANMLLKAIADLQPDCIIATFDSGRTFRHESYDGYKATRAETPDDLRTQFERIGEVVQALHIPIVVKEGYEADDLLGTLSAQANAEGLDTIIATGDTDTFQLVSDHVRVLYPQRTVAETKLYDREAVLERYGLTPEQLIDYKALVGDTSDNIPGVSGVGDKTATRLLQEYGTLEEIYAHLEEVKPPRFRTALEQGRASAEMSKQLVTIVRDVPDVQLDVATSTWGQYDRAEVRDLFRRLGFTSLVSRIPGDEVAAPAGAGLQLSLFGGQEPGGGQPAGAEYAVVDTVPALEALVKRLRAAGRFALDTETTSTDAMGTRLVGIGVAEGPGTASYIPVGHDERLRPGAQLPLAEVQRILSPLLADGAVAKVCHNAKFDMTVLARHGLPVQGLAFDTMLAAWLLEPSGRGIGLKAQALQRLGVEMQPIEDLIGKGRNQVTLDMLPVRRVADYCGADADMTLRLADLLEQGLRETAQEGLFHDVEMPLVPILMDIEMRGMVVDVAYLEAMSRELTARLAELSEQIYTQAGRPFNLNSPKQLAEVLFDDLGLPSIRRTRTGHSTDAAVLEALQDKHPIVNLILEHRSLEKIKGTYVDTLPTLVNPTTGRVHTWLSQTSTSTGRLASSEPNLQNIPVRTELGRQVRGAFVAPEGHVLLGADYSQVELRLLAHLSQDPELLGAFARDEDVHASTAAAILGVPLETVTPDQRALAKTINFGLMYGMGDYGLSSRTDLSVDEAREFIDAYFGRFQRVKEYLDGTVAFARREGYVQTVLGRRRYFPELRASGPANRGLIRAAERQAINMPIQGSAADIIKLAMIALHRLLQEEGLRARMVLQVHDELVLEVPQDEVPRASALVVSTMENAYQLSVPLKVDVAIGKNWMEMK